MRAYFGRAHCASARPDPALPVQQLCTEGPPCCTLVAGGALTGLNVLQVQQCSAGDSAAYDRQAPSLDDVVVVSSLRTATCKVHHPGTACMPTLLLWLCMPSLLLWLCMPILLLWLCMPSLFASSLPSPASNYTCASPRWQTYSVFLSLIHISEPTRPY